MDLRGGSQQIDGPFGRLLLGLHVAAKPGGLGQIPAQNQSRPQANSTATRCAKVDPQEKPRFTEGLHERNETNAAAPGGWSVTADTSFGSYSANCRQLGFAGGHFSTVSERG